ncbi:MAG: ATP-grasp domain-containing protein [Halobacteriovoraceae bacterium]|nr:ATP-grasp domain-containing protein [Halobacteriovoraceae bacterium]
MKKSIIFITAGKWQKCAIEMAKEMGLYVIAIDANPTAEGFSIANKKIICSLENTDEIISEIEKTGTQVLGALSICSEAGMILTGKLRDHFQLPCAGYEVTLKLMNKKLQRAALEKFNLNRLKWKSFENPDEAKKYICEQSIDLIIKPVDSSGSRGVTKVNYLTTDLDEIIQRAFDFSNTKEVIVEEFIPGDEHTVETFTLGGVTQLLCLTKKKKLDLNGKMVAYELATIQYEDHLMEKVSSFISKAFESLGYTDGPGHSEIIINNNEIWIVELSGRGGGFKVFEEFVPKVSGFDIVESTILQSIGEKVILDLSNRQQGILSFFPSHKGVVKEVIGFEKARELPGVFCASFVNVGEKVNDVNGDGDRLGYVLSVDSDIQKAYSKLAQAQELIYFKID